MLNPRRLLIVGVLSLALVASVAYAAFPLLAAGALFTSYRLHSVATALLSGAMVSSVVTDVPIARVLTYDPTTGKSALDCPAGAAIGPISCYIRTIIATNTDYVPPTPPAPAQQLDPLTPAAFTVTANSVSALNGLAAPTWADLIVEMNKQLASQANVSQPWYGKIRVVNMARQIPSGGASYLPATNTATGPFYPVYEVLGDFKTNDCSLFKSGGVLYWGGGGDNGNVYTLESLPSGVSCSFSETGKARVNSGKQLLQAGALHPAGTAILSYTVSYTSPACDSGYTYSLLTLQCELTNTAAVASAPDGVCPYPLKSSTSYSRNTTDPDCVRIQNLGAVAFSNNDGTVSVAGVDPEDNTIKHNASNSRDALGNNSLNVKTYYPTGATQQFTTSATPAGQVINIVVNPPTYQPSPTGTASNPVVTIPAPGTGAVQCGGTGMPPCSVALTGEINVPAPVVNVPAPVVNIPPPCGVPGSAPCSIAEMDKLIEAVQDKSSQPETIGGDEGADLTTRTDQDTFLDTVLAFKGFQLDDPNYACSSALDLGAASATDLNFTGYGESIPVTFNLAEACPLIEPHEDDFRDLSILLWYVAAILVLLRLTI